MTQTAPSHPTAFSPRSLERCGRLRTWIDERGGIAHRDAASDAGFALTVQREAVRMGIVGKVRRHWLMTPSCAGDLLTAARSSGVLTCVSAARRYGWWLPPDVDQRVHIQLKPHGRPPCEDAVAHWSAPLAPARGKLLASVEDTLRDVASCLGHASALVVWESAIRTENLAIDALRLIPWRRIEAARLADEVRGLSDSGLETFFAVRLTAWGVPFVQQAVVAGHRVDLLVGRRLVIQIDGFSYHSTAAQRGRDVALDAELVMRGYTVLRFTYAQVIHDWASVERALSRAIAAGLHR
ncbi:DUF559 domain-containing protein [Microbacterium sp. CCNWLW134]|uniref:endonuclease domain-containing protein n=1 Tax=Microbacterium sp. CCNWLW134 TaxID=3122064 RepID=UPI00300FA364